MPIVRLSTRFVRPAIRPDDLAEGADEPKDPADERNDEDDDHQWEDDGGAGHANGYSDTGVRWRFVCDVES